MTTWFGAEVGRSDEERAFLAEIRRLAAQWQMPDLDPTRDTASAIVLEPLYLAVTVAGAPPSRNTLQLGYFSGPPYARLWGEWGDEYLLDGHSGEDPEDLTVHGLTAEPEDFARWAAMWIAQQLARPMAREEWTRGDVVVFTAWRFLDTGHVLERQGPVLRRLPRHPPDRRVLVRGVSDGSL